MHIGIVAWSLLENIGGIERMCCALAEDMLARGHRVSLLCKEAAPAANAPTCRIPDKSELLVLQLDYDTLCLDDARARIAGCGLDVLVAAFSWESLLWFPWLLQGTGIPLVISEHSKPEWIDGRWNAYERHCCLDCADSIHILLRSFMEAYPERLRERIRVIPNPAFFPGSPSRSGKESGRRTLLSAGRFDDQVKQFSLLLKAFALLKDRYPDWDLELCGDGPAMEEYRRLAVSLGLEDRLRLPGMLDDMTQRYAAADIFCIPSNVEGFGMVTVEAQAMALPVVGFAGCSGVNEIVVHGENGRLAAEMTPECLAHNLAMLMDDAGLRRRMGERGKEMLARFAPRLVYDAWERMLLETAAAKGGTRMQAMASADAEGDAALLAVRELLGRKHPFDRRRYLRMHKACVARGLDSPFSENEIAGFIKKQQKFGFPGYRSPLTELRRLARRLLVRRLSRRH